MVEQLSWKPMIKSWLFQTTIRFKKVKQLEQMLCRKTVEAESLKDALEIVQAKKYISLMPVLPPDGTQHNK